MTNAVLNCLDRCARQRGESAWPAEIDTLGTFAGFGVRLIQSWAEMSKRWLVVSLARMGSSKLRHVVVKSKTWYK